MVSRDQTLRVFCIGTADSKLDELQFLSHSVQSNLRGFSKNPSLNPQVVVVDVSVGVGEKQTESLGDFTFISRKEVLGTYFGSSERISTQLLPDDRGEAIAVMCKALQSFLRKAHEDGVVSGAVGIGGSGGTALISPALRSLPLGIPKLIVSTVASGQTEPYVGTSDLVLFPSIVDVCGINSVSRAVFSNAGAAFAGMVIGRLERSRHSSSVDEEPTVGVTMFGVTTPCVNVVKERLAKEGYETLFFMPLGLEVEPWSHWLGRDP